MSLLSTSFVPPFLHQYYPYVLHFITDHEGLLVHMEHIASALRGQGSEETERLRQEHHRLQVMQVTTTFMPILNLSF